MGWSKQKKELDPTGEALAKRIAETILSWQHRIANKLNARVKKCNKKRFLTIILMFSIAFGGYCLWLILGIFR